MEKSYSELRIEVLLSFQKALLGVIYPAIRKIGVGFTGIDKLKVVFYSKDKILKPDDIVACVYSRRKDFSYYPLLL